MDHQSDICGVTLCSKLVKDGIQCDRCGRWYHEKCSQMPKQSYLLQKKHTELQWICVHCVALAEVCSRILMRGTVSVKSTEERKPSEECETKPSGDQVVGSSKNKSNEGKKPKSTEISKPKTGVPIRASEVEQLQDRIGLLEKQVLELQQSTKVLLSRTKSIMLHNLAEPLIRNVKARREADRRHVLDVLRLAGMPPTTVFTKYHRVGTWKGAHIAKPRPIMVVFPSTHSRDQLLSRAYMVQMNTNGYVRVTPDEGLQNSTAAPATSSQGGKSRGTLEVRLERISSVPREEPARLEEKNRKSVPPFNNVRGSPMSKSTPQKNEPLAKSEVKKRSRRPKKTEADEVESKASAGKSRGSKKPESEGSDHSVLQGSEEVKPTTSSNKILATRSWNEVAAAAPVNRTLQQRARKNNQVSLNMSEAVGLTCSNIEMTRGEYLGSLTNR